MFPIPASIAGDTTTAPHALVVPPVVPASPNAAVVPMVSTATCEGAFQVGGCAVAPDFFLGAIDEENDEEEDRRVVHNFGFAQATLLPGAPKMSWVDTITYRATSPFMVRQGEIILHKEWRP